MQIVPSTVLALLLAVLLFVRGPQRGLWVVLAATPFGAAAAFNLPALGGASIGVLDFVVAALFAYVLLLPNALNRLAGVMRPGQPGFWLALLFVIGAVSAVFFPMVFAGRTMVFAIDRGANALGIVEVPLRFSTGNITQAFRMTLEVMAFFALAMLFRDRPDARPVVVAMAVAASVNVALGWLDVLTSAAGIEAVMEPLRTANYAMLVDHRMIGLKRMIGGFPEASSFGAYSLGLFAFWLGYVIHGPRSRLGAWMLGLTALVLLRSTSSAAYVALAAFVAVLIALSLATGLRPVLRRRRLSFMLGGLFTIWLAAVAIFAGYELVPAVRDFMDRALFDKLGTSSGVERMSWNVQALRNMVDTFLVGAGLGSVRASSWLAACLGSFGILGTLVALRFLLALSSSPMATGETERDRVIRGLRYACLALVLQALLASSTPNLGIMFYLSAGLLVGLSRGGTIERAGPRATGSKISVAKPSRPSGLARHPSLKVRHPRG